MLKIYLLISIITSMSFAQTMTLDVRDYFTKKPIILDSINIKNTILGIDTTVANPKIIDFTELFIINSVQSKRYFDISLNNNQLVVSSNERIENIKMFDLLGREVINANVNNTSFRANIENRNNSLLYFISIKTKSGYHHSKIVNSTYKNLQTANVLPNSTNWEFTLYKLGYLSDKVELPNIPLTLKFDLKRIPITGIFNFRMDSLEYKFNRFDHEPWNDDETNYSVKGAIDFNFNLQLFSIDKSVKDKTNINMGGCNNIYTDFNNGDYISYTKIAVSNSIPINSFFLYNTFWYYIELSENDNTLNVYIGTNSEEVEMGQLVDDWVCMKIKLIDINLNNLYNGTTNLISFELNDSTNQSISFNLHDITVLGPTLNEEMNIKMTGSTKTIGNITFELAK